DPTRPSVAFILDREYDGHHMNQEPSMQLSNAVVLVTGANRGIGLAFAREALARGARKVYAAARDPASVQIPGVQPIQIDVTDADQVARAARDCGDVTVVINNAGIATTGGFLQDTTLEASRR